MGFLPDKLVMLDCEMTGVDCTKHELLQAAFVKLQLDQNLQYQEVGEPLVLHFKTDAVPSNDFHKRYLTHIFEACNQSDLEAPRAQEMLHEWLGDWKGVVTPTGDCVITDLEFLKHNGVVVRNDIVDDQPVPGTFHYEIFDLNAPKAFARHSVGEKFAVAGLDEENIHDALVDCRNQTLELNEFIKVLLPEQVSEGAHRTMAVNEELLTFMESAGKGFYSYDYLMSPEADGMWSEQQEFNESEGEEQTREEWARSLDEFHQTSGDPSMVFDTAKKIKSTDWLIHFTDANPLDIIKQGFRGRSVDIIGLTTYYKEGTNPGPLALAYRVEDVPPPHYRSRVFGKYGDNAVLFKAKEGARAWHNGDEEYQVVFTASTAYSMYPIFGESDFLELYDPKKLVPVTRADRNAEGLDEILSRVRSKNMKPDSTVESAKVEAGAFKELMIEQEDRMLAEAAGHLEWQEAFKEYDRIERQDSLYRKGPGLWPEETSGEGRVHPAEDFEQYEWEIDSIPIKLLKWGKTDFTEPLWTEGYRKPTEPFSLEKYEELLAKKEPEYEEKKYLQVWADEHHALEYAKRNTEPPPIFAVWDAGYYKLWNGRHRTRAAVLNGKDKIKAFVGVKPEHKESDEAKIKAIGSVMKEKRMIKADLDPMELPEAVQPVVVDDGKLPDTKIEQLVQFNQKALRADSFQDFQELLNAILLQLELTEDFRPSVAGVLNEYRVSQGYVPL